MTTVTERACNWKHLLCIKESEDPCPDALRVLRLGLAGSAVTYVVFVFSKQFGVNKGLRAAQAWRALARFATATSLTKGSARSTGI